VEEAQSDCSQAARTGLRRPTGEVMVDTAWIDDVPPRHAPYWEDVRKAAAVLKSDGCTGVVDICVDSCYEHDVHWRTGHTIYGDPITTKQANRRFRKVIAARFGEHGNGAVRAIATPLGYAFSWGRWAGVTVGAKFLKHKSR
jgi:hypothetical protein